MNIRRRLLAALGASAFAYAVPCIAQQSKTFRVGWLTYGRGMGGSRTVDAFRGGMRDLGYIEGRNLTIIERASEANREQATALAAELIAAKPDVIVTLSASVFAVPRTGIAIPIVFGFSGDPVIAHLVESFAHPGGNLTGLSFLSLELAGKRMELLKEVMPKMKRVAIVANQQHPGVQAEKNAALAAANSLGLTVDYFQLGTPAELDTVLAAIAGARSEAIVVFPDSFTMTLSEKFAAFASKQRIPAISGWAHFAEQGNLMSYGPQFEDSFRRFAIYVDKILKGAKPADLPVELPTKFELVANLKTAKALGIIFPQTVLIRADKVIE